MRNTSIAIANALYSHTDDTVRECANIAPYGVSPLSMENFIDLVSGQISHDDPMSIIHDYTTEEKNPIPLKIQSFSDERLSSLSFLFGGVGDGTSSPPM